MKKTIIAFDVDGTLIDTDGFMNIGVVNLLILLSGFKNTKIIVWSGGGADYARHHAERIGIGKYVSKYADKNHLGKVDGKHQFDPAFQPDIAIDDIQDCELGKINLIVREK